MCGESGRSCNRRSAGSTRPTGSPTSLKNHSSIWLDGKAFGERVSQFMENPLQGAKGAVSSVLTALGPFGIAVATGAAVLGTIAVSAFEGPGDGKPATDDRTVGE